ncbi:MAG: M28 family peptidase [Acidimicrobiia bacterium]|nr:M28 family peptidase [Acidimicrobiia bacterium]
MVRGLLVAVGVLATTVCASASQAPQAPVKATFDGARAFEHLKAQVAIGPRPAGSTGIRQTRAYLTRQLTAMGLTVEEQPFVATTPIGPVEMVNLVTVLPGRRPERILLTGHYDTKLYKDIVFLGASDGASSAALLVELARVLKDQPREFTYEFVWFDGEEAIVEWDIDTDSTYGSRYYVQAAQKAGALARIKAMILVDMIGHRDLQIERDSHSAVWLTDIIWSTARRLGHGNIFRDVLTTIEDDHVHFVRAGIPSVDIIDLNHFIARGHWHTVSDDLNAVSAQSLQIVGDVLVAALPDIEQYLGAQGL